ncbi:calcium/calmodulin-dependent protein kinase [Penicillium pulvis]|uniref:calcium/calmodulin-dependent protein kinase n=1 Tax=Penicillium pulvis TaxID=1562058 RepID=UPI0025495E55|nr:calcium/calmodulin-dependent protein kinase [Penicillium pulvis]KAJ5792798.1 calcium/calmodulin-dependent protein kinase [Penicillium pulvis]
MSTTTISRPAEPNSFTGNRSVMERIRERRRAAEAKQAREVDTSNLSVGFMSKSQRASNMPNYPGLDRWRLLEKIGDGAFSCVYRASDTKSELGEVAIKVTKKYEMKEEQKKKLHDEVEITRKLDHDNVVRLIDASESVQYHYMFLELCPGGELYDQIVKFASLSEQMARHVIWQVANAVQYLHDTMGVVHRDIKPENILFYPNSTTPREESKSTQSGDEEEAVSIADVGASDIGVVKLADFGLSKVIAGVPAATPCGTMSYAAPELFRKHRYTTSVDMWALGCLLFTMLAGFPPFYDEDLDIMRRQIMQGEYSFSAPKWDTISDGAKDLVSRLLTINPEERSTIQECLDHPWMHEDSEDKTPTNDVFTPNNERHHASTGTTPMLENFQIADNESGETCPQTPNIRDIFNVALSVHKEQHQSQQTAENQKSADGHRFKKSNPLSNLSMNNSKLLEKRRMRADGGQSIPSC